MNDYIFCPLCGSPDWNTDKTRELSEGRLIRFSCKECNEFTYNNLQRLVKHEFLVGITEVCRYSEMVTIDQFHIVVQFIEPEGPVTHITDYDSTDLLLSLGKAIKFNWYNKEETLEKIRKYLVFS